MEYSVPKSIQTRVVRMVTKVKGRLYFLVIVTKLLNSLQDLQCDNTD